MLMYSEPPKEEEFLRERDALIDHIAKILAEEYLRIVRQGDIDPQDNGGTKKGE
jgi:hypothetical protein